MAIAKECKRLAEVEFPIGRVGAAVLSRAKRFPLPRGLPSTIHHRWPRRPPGSYRAVLQHTRPAAGEWWVPVNTFEERANMGFFVTNGETSPSGPASGAWATIGRLVSPYRY